MKHDHQFRKKIMALETLEERVRQLKAEGFDCTVDELRSMHTQMSEDELEGISAGSGDGNHKTVTMCYCEEQDQLFVQHSQRQARCFKSSSLVLTMAPTLRYNFRCPYCFESSF